jgi:CubicO group peptidase (beta-lactamase class C family)
MAVLCAAVPTAFAQSNAVDRAARMDQIVQNYVDNKSFMGAVLVSDHDSIVLNKGYGDADLEWSIANTPDTKFRIGSITKQFTAASVLLLAERNKLKIDEPVKTYLPDAPVEWDKITLRNLLTHTSGIPNFTGGPGWDDYKRHDHTPQESIALFRDKPLDFEPGAKFAYSNSNYILLGQIVEKVSGMPYEKFLQQNIFTPLRMEDTGVDVASAIVSRRARGYEAGPDGFRHADFVSMTIPYAAGFLYSTTGDLLKWERALFGGKVLTANSLRTMTTAGLGDYGMGLFIRDAAHHGVITHNGSIEGFDTSLNYYPEKQFTVIVLGNVKTEAPDKIAEQLGKVAYGEKVVVNSDRKIVPVSPEVLATYAGHYSAPPFAITLSVESGQLIATTPSGRTYVLHAESDTQFFLKEIDVQIEFVRDPATKKVSEFLMTQEGVQKRVARD